MPETSQFEQLIDGLAQLDHQATAGDWGWFGNTETGQVYIATRHSGRVFVLMPNVEPSPEFEQEAIDHGHLFRQDIRFQNPAHGVGGTISYRDVAVYEVCPEAVGKPDDPRVYRKDFLDLDHPDARMLITGRNALPTLLQIIRRLHNVVKQRAAGDEGGSERAVLAEVEKIAAGA